MRTAMPAVIVALLAAASGVAKEPLVTDRPDFTESALAVGRGTLQLEAGVTHSRFEEGNLTTLGELLVRYGVGRKLELRLVTFTYAWLDESASNRSGFIDSAIGFKYEFNDGGGSGFLGRTAAGVIFSSTFPSGNSEFRSSAWQPVVIVPLSWELNERVGLGASFGYARPEEDGRRFDSLFASVVAGVGVTDATSLFFELFGFDREEARGPNTVTFQTGVTYLLSSDLQLDVRVARRLTDGGPGFLLGAGVSWRLGG